MSLTSIYLYESRPSSPTTRIAAWLTLNKTTLQKNFKKTLMKLARNTNVVIPSTSKMQLMPKNGWRLYEIYHIDFSKKAEKVIKKWKKSNPVLFKKLHDLLPELEEHPETGTGHPEPLVGENSITYSRHISAHDRIIYDIYREEVVVLIIKAEEHYNDK